MPYPHSLADLCTRTIGNNLHSIQFKKHALPDELNIRILQHLRNQGIISHYSLSLFLVPRIHSINLSSCVQVDDTCVQIISSVCNHVQNIILNKCPMITDNGIRNIIENCVGLRVLHIAKCFQITDYAFSELLSTQENAEGDNNKQILEQYTMEDGECEHVESGEEGDQIQGGDKRLSLLIELDISGTKITDVAIQHITSRCKEMKLLDISDCSISVQSIKLIGERVKGLRMLRASGCHLDYGNCLSFIQGLEGVVVRQCPLIGDTAILDIVNCCPNLSSLDLQWSGVTDVSAAALEKVATRLTSLRLAWCGLIGEQALSSLLPCCTNLQSLDLSWRSLHDWAFKQVPLHCTNLKFLDISGCNELTEASLSDCGGSYLEFLSMSWCRGLSDSAFRQIVRRSPNLKSLDISLCSRVTPAALSELSLCTKLQVLLVSKCSQIVDAPLLEVAKFLPELTVINLSECNVTDAAVSEIAQQCNKLRIVVLAGCRTLTAKSLDMLSFFCPNLETLNVSGSGVNDESLKTLAMRCGGLTSLTLSSCCLVSDEGLMHLATYSRVLQVLYVSYCVGITELGLGHVMRKCTYLQVIEFANCQTAKDDLLYELVMHAPLIQVINAAGCSLLTDKTIDHLWVYTNHMTSLDVTRCPQITGDALDNLMRRLPTLTIRRST